MGNILIHLTKSCLILIYTCEAFVEKMGLLWDIVLKFVLNILVIEMDKMWMACSLSLCNHRFIYVITHDLSYIKQY